jgi:hypothetical protein
MTPSEIIKKDAEQRGIDPQKLLASVAVLMKKNNALMLKENDSILILHPIGDGEGDVELHLFTEDAPLTLAKSLTNFIKKIRASDLRAVYGDADNEQITQFLTRLGVEVTESDKPNYNWMALV